MTDTLNESIFDESLFTQLSTSWEKVMGKVLFSAVCEVLPDPCAVKGSPAHAMAFANALAEQSQLGYMAHESLSRLISIEETCRQNREDKFSTLSEYRILNESLSDEEIESARSLPLEQTAIGRKRLQIISISLVEGLNLKECRRESKIYCDLREEHRDAGFYLEALRNGLPVPIGVARRREERGMMRGGLALEYGRDLERTH